MYLIPN